MKVGNLVRGIDKDYFIGIVVATRRHMSSTDSSSYVYWIDFDGCWIDDDFLEVISESR